MRRHGHLLRLAFAPRAGLRSAHLRHGSRHRARHLPGAGRQHGAVLAGVRRVRPERRGGHRAVQDPRQLQQQRGHVRVADRIRRFLFGHLRGIPRGGGAVRGERHALLQAAQQARRARRARHVAAEVLARGDGAGDDRALRGVRGGRVDEPLGYSRHPVLRYGHGALHGAEPEPGDCDELQGCVQGSRHPRGDVRVHIHGRRDVPGGGEVVDGSLRRGGHGGVRGRARVERVPGHTVGEREAPARATRPGEPHEDALRQRFKGRHRLCAGEHDDSGSRRG